MKELIARTKKQGALNRCRKLNHAYSDKLDICTPCPQRYSEFQSNDLGGKYPAEKTTVKAEEKV